MPLRLRRSHVESQLSCGPAPFHLFNLALLPKKDVLCTLSHFIAVQCTRANAFLRPLENSPQVLWFVLCVANTNSHNDTKAKLALIMGGTIIHEHYNELPSFLPSFRVRVHVHGRVAVLVATPLSSIVPSVIYGSTLSYRAIHLLIAENQGSYFG